VEIDFHISPGLSGKCFSTIVQNRTHLPLTARLPFDSIPLVPRTLAELILMKFLAFQKRISVMRSMI
jgi:hypothetical protein